jgi:hypothetical protein
VNVVGRNTVKESETTPDLLELEFRVDKPRKFERGIQEQLFVTGLSVGLGMLGFSLWRWLFKKDDSRTEQQHPRQWTKDSDDSSDSDSPSS